jgi:hypothetical protein
MPESAVTPKDGPVQTSPTVAAVTSPPPKLRFSWPMRIFLFCLLFDIIFRSFSVMFPWKDWIDDFDMRRAPRPLPTCAEYAQLRGQGGDVLQKDLDKSFVSIRDYFNPWPNSNTRGKLTNLDACGKYAFAWVASRLDIVENICGINEEWPMFSPNASRGDYFARSRLLYADGSERLIRQNSEPADLTRFTRWNKEKILDHETKVKWTSSREDECWAWCGMLAHRHARNDDGSPLKTILLYRVYIDYPAPNDPDPRGFLLEQMELTRDHNSEMASRTFYTYDVESRTGTMEKKKDE